METTAAEAIINFKSIETLWADNATLLDDLANKAVEKMGAGYTVTEKPSLLHYNFGTGIRIRKDSEKVRCVTLCVNHQNGQPSVIFHNPNEHEGSIVYNYNRFNIGSNPVDSKTLDEICRRIKGFIETGNMA